MDSQTKSNLIAISLEAIDEAERAINKYKRPYASAHEFYGVLQEEIDELWDEIKKRAENRDIEKMRKEAIQCTAVLMRFINEIEISAKV